MSEAIVTQAAFRQALATASRISLSAYVLDPRNGVVRALEAAADRGARIDVLLEGAPFGDGSHGMADRNARVARELASHGVTVRRSSPSDPTVHSKAALVDGVAYFDDRNWPNHGFDTVIATDDPSNVASEKSAALALEADAIAHGSGDRIDVESETFGYSAVSRALIDRARAGAHVRLLVCAREYHAGGRTERASLARLAAAGVAIRIVENDEKLCASGDRAWAGSANATYDAGPTLDWGIETHEPGVVRGIESAFERNWKCGTAVRPGVSLAARAEERVC